MTAPAPLTVQVGDLVWRTLYSPGPAHTGGDWPPLDAMITAGTIYKPRELVRVTHVGESVDHVSGGVPVITWSFADPDRPRDQSGWSSACSSWCVLEPHVEDGALW